VVTHDYYGPWFPLNYAQVPSSSTPGENREKQEIGFRIGQLILQQLNPVQQQGKSVHKFLWNWHTLWNGMLLDKFMLID